jgi:SAM-dependent methyltransferase
VDGQVDVAGDGIDPGNREQAAAWNGAEGANWVQQADRFEACTAAYVPPLMEAAEIAGADRVLDVGCGNGGSTCTAALTAPEGHATGFDLSGPMVAEARLRAAARGIANVNFEQGDAQVHPFPPGAFDAAISKLAVMFFADPVAGFVNIGRALRPGGRLGLVVWRGLEHNEWFCVLRERLAAGRELPVPVSGVPGPFGMADADHVRGALDAAGFVAVAIDAVDAPFDAGPDVDVAMEFALASTFARAILADLDDTTRARAVGDLRDAVTRHLSGDGVTLASSCWVVGARRA